MSLVANSLDQIKRGNYAEVEILFSRSGKKKFDTNELNVLAISLFKQERVIEGLKHLKLAIMQGPVTAPMFFNLGKAFYSLGEVESATKAFNSCLRIDSNYIAALNAIAVILHEHGDDLGAKQILMKVLRLDRTNQDALTHIAAVCNSLGEYQEACGYLSTVVELGLANEHILNSLGNLKTRLEDRSSALQLYDQALSINPLMVEAYVNKAAALLKNCQPQSALIELDRSLQIDPHNAIAHYLKGQALFENKDFEACLVSCQQAFDLSNENNPEILKTLINIKLELCDWRYFNEITELYLQSIREGCVSTGPLVPMYISDDCDLHLQSSTSYFANRRKLNVPLFKFERTSGDRIKLGYISPDFGDHPVGQLMAEVFEQHDRNKFEIFLFCLRDRTGEKARKRLLDSCDHFIELGALSTEEMCVEVRRHGLDATFDLAGFTMASRPEIFAARMSPVQINYLGFPGTTGSSAHDFILADTVVIPEELAEHYAEEKLIMDRCFFPCDSSWSMPEIPSRDSLGLPANTFIFSCFNATRKITPHMARLWANILKAIPDSALWLHPRNQQAKNNLKCFFKNEGVDPERLIYASFAPTHADHLARIAAADLFLDTFPYGAHTTGMESLYAKVPILTLCGSSFASRVSASILSHIGLSELISFSKEEYFEKACHLATHHSEMEAIRLKLQSFDFQASFSGRKLANSIERAVEHALNARNLK